MVDSCHIHSSSPLAMSDQVQGAGYSESKVEIDATTLKLETDTSALDLETVTDVSQEISKQERYSAD
jgi:hypothetical protein